MKRKFCFDLDGTITKQEILPIIASEAGIHEEIEALTKATISGVIPFKQSFLLRTRLLKEVPVSKVQEICRGIELNNQIVDFIKSNLNDCCIITGNLDKWISKLVDRIGCEIYCSKALVRDDKLVKVLTVLDKGEITKLLVQKYEIIAIGDGMGDVGMFENAHTRIAFGGVHRPITPLIELSDLICYSEKSLCQTLNTLL